MSGSDERDENDAGGVANPTRTRIDDDDAPSQGPLTRPEDEQAPQQHHDPRDQPWDVVAEEVKKAVEGGPPD